MLDIDGTVLEGGGQILRMAMALSVLKGTSIRVYNIRAGRTKPGLKAQHLKGLEITANLSNGKLEGAFKDSEEIVFRPSTVKGGEYRADTQTAGGYFPKGGGEVHITVHPVKALRAVELTQIGDVVRVWGKAFVAGNVPFTVAQEMAAGARRLLSCNVKVAVEIAVVKESPDIAVGSGSGIYIFAETTTGCILGGTGLGERNIPNEKIGYDAAMEIINALNNGFCVDSFAQDQVILLMALAKGLSRIRCGPITLHTKTAIYIAELMTSVTFKITSLSEESNIIECQGIALENAHVPHKPTKAEQCHVEERPFSVH